MAVLRALDDASLSGVSARARRWPARAGIAALLGLVAAGGYASIRGGASPTVAPTLRGTLAGPEAQGISGRPPGDSAAQALYLKGRYLWRTTQLTREATLQAGRFYAAAIARDSSYAPAYAGLSEVHARLAIFGYGLPQPDAAHGT